MLDRPPVTLRNALLRRRGLVLLVVAAFVLLGGVLSLRPNVYESSAGIYIDATRSASSFDAGLATAQLLQHDFIVLGTSRQVLLQACASPGVNCTAAERASPTTTLARRLDINVFRGTSLLEVTAKAADPNDAATLANAVARAMIDNDQAEIIRLFKPTLDDLQQQLTQLSAAIDREQLALQHSPAASSAAASHQAQLARLQGQYSATFARQQDVMENQDRYGSLATIIQPAVPNATPEAPDPPRYLLAALIAGLCVAVVAALAAERLDDRIFDAEGLAMAAGIPVAMVAQPVGRRLPSPEHIPYSVALAGVLARAPDAHSLLVTAASRRDPSDRVAEGLGTVAAHAGQRVVVVQSDRHPGNGQWFPRREAEGMTTIAVPSNNGSGSAAAVTDLVRQYEFPSAGAFVLVSAPSPDSSPTALMLGQTTKRTVLAATARRTRFRDARRTADMLRQAGVEVVGGILLPRGSQKKAR